MQGMLDLIALVKNTGLPWEILTATGEINRPLVVADKIAWIHQHVDPHVVVTCTIKGKHKAVFAKPGDVLVDDKKSNCDAWKAAGGISVHHTSMASTLAQLEYLANQEDLKVAN
jgi:5'(3')-deoxyribonucleotidase